MSTFEIKVAPSVADQRFHVVLEQETFALRCRWNESASMWLLDVGDSTGTIVAGLPLVLSAPLIRRFSNRRLPKGELLCIDTTAQDLEAGLADLGARVKLLYIESADLPAR